MASTLTSWQLYGPDEKIRNEVAVVKYTKKDKVSCFCSEFLCNRKSASVSERARNEIIYHLTLEYSIEGVTGSSR